MMKKNKLALVAFGGNVMIPANSNATAKEQFKSAKRAAKIMVDIMKKGYELIIVHGNGPQIGNLLLQMESASNIVPPFPIDICDAMTEGSMGYMLERAILNEMRKQSIDKEVVSILTQVIVDRDDMAFENPTKPIGPFYNFFRAQQLKRENKWEMLEEAGRGFRRVVPSPKPIDIVPKRTIRAMIEKGIVVIAAGGGGIPVFINSLGYIEGIEAVIDKDYTSSLIAKEAGVELFIILTGVDRVMEDFGKKNAKPIKVMDINEAQRMMDEEQFPPGSMGPKISAAIDYIKGGGKEVLITSSEKVRLALIGRSGTRIIMDKEVRKGDNSGSKS